MASRKPASDVYDNVGRSVRNHRRAAGLTLEALAEAAGLSPAYIGQVERNGKKPSLHTLALLATALDVGVDRLIDHHRAPARPSPARRIEQTLRCLSAREQEIIVSILRNLVKGMRSTR